MAAASDNEPPVAIRYSLAEALDLLADLEDARDVLIDSDRLAAVVVIEAQIRLLSRRLGLEDPEGGSRAE